MYSIIYIYYLYYVHLATSHKRPCALLRSEDRRKKKIEKKSRRGKNSLADNKSSDSNENRVRRRSVSVSDPVINCCVFIIKQCTAAAANPEEDISIGRAAAVDGVGVGPDKQMHLERSTMQGVIMFPSFTQYTHAHALYIHIYVLYVYIYIIYVFYACVRVRLCTYIRREVYASTTTAKTISLTHSLSFSRIPFGIYPPLRFVLYFFFISYYLFIVFSFFFLYTYLYSVSRGLGR